MWICKHCQNQNEENFKFCWSCGYSKSASRKTVRGNTTELTPPNKITDQEIPRVKEIKNAANEPIEKVEKTDPINVEVRTKEKPIFDNTEDEVLTHPQPMKTKAEVKEQKPNQSINKPKNNTANEPEIFSNFSTKAKNSSRVEHSDGVTNWQKVIFTIAVRLIGLYFVFQVIIALPDLANLAYTTISAGIALEGDLANNWLPLLTPWVKYLFYLILGIYFISSGKVLIKLLPEE